MDGGVRGRGVRGDHRRTMCRRNAPRNYGVARDPPIEAPTQMMLLRFTRVLSLMVLPLLAAGCPGIVADLPTDAGMDGADGPRGQAGAGGKPVGPATGTGGVTPAASGGATGSTGGAIGSSGGSGVAGAGATGSVGA